MFFSVCSSWICMVSWMQPYSNISISPNILTYSTIKKKKQASKYKRIVYAQRNLNMNKSMQTMQTHFHWFIKQCSRLQKWNGINCKKNKQRSESTLSRSFNCNGSFIKEAEGDSYEWLNLLLLCKHHLIEIIGCSLSNIMWLLNGGLVKGVDRH